MTISDYSQVKLGKKAWICKFNLRCSGEDVQLDLIIVAVEIEAMNDITEVEHEAEDQSLNLVEHLGKEQQWQSY